MGLPRSVGRVERSIVIAHIYRSCAPVRTGTSLQYHHTTAMPLERMVIFLVTAIFKNLTRFIVGANQDQTSMSLQEFLRRDMCSCTCSYEAVRRWRPNDTSASLTATEWNQIMPYQLCMDYHPYLRLFFC